MIKRILVATDASRAANRAVDLAADVAAKYGSSLDILHVVRRMQLPPELLRMAQVEKIAGREADILAFVAQKILSGAEARAKKKGATDVCTAMDAGDPAIAIIKHAKRHHVDLIVMGTRGLGKVKEVFLGSVSRKVCNLSPVSCLTVR